MWHEPRPRCWLCGATAAVGADHVSSSEVAQIANPCPRCGSLRELLETPCSACRWIPPPTRERPIIATRAMRLHALRTFSLESILLVVTLVAVILGVSAWAPGPGITLAVVSTPALLRAVGIRIRKKARGESMTAAEKFWAFTSSIGVVLTILFSWVTTFLVVCLSTGVVASSLDPVGLKTIVLIMGFGLSLFVCYRAGRWLWREFE